MIELASQFGTKPVGKLRGSTMYERISPSYITKSRTKEKEREVAPPLYSE
jgi:hypothetical protein